MDASRAANPLFGPNRFKLGVFSANCDGGLTMSLAPERWACNWDDIVAMSQMADESGLEFILPVAKWRGFQGEANICGKSFETLTHGAALSALTKRIAVFSTVHVPLVTPAFAAKAIATIDHVSHGRAGLNIVCGWNQNEFDLHGVHINQDTRYHHGLEWFEIWSRMLSGGPEFDWDGKFFHLKKLHTNPLSIQRPWPAVMAAGFSPAGRDFAARAADVLFLTVTDLEQVSGILASVAVQMAKYDRTISVFTMGHVVCRPTRKEAEDYFHYFAEAMGDPEGQAYFRENRGTTVSDGTRQIPRPLLNRFHRTTGLNYAGAYPGTYPFVGSPDDIAGEMARMCDTGIAGTAVAFVDYLREIPFFLAEVLPRLRRLGVRN
jgi:alkanesulfonate monooxygenase SsuD/methylene tetrahydromethanopterin reductase-like flavin-dependent oxidoreductase (luciferase family)